MEGAEPESVASGAPELDKFAAHLRNTTPAFNLFDDVLWDTHRLSPCFPERYLFSIALTMRHPAEGMGA